MNIQVIVSMRDFFDKLTILEIKRERIKDDTKLKNINMECTYLTGLIAGMEVRADDIKDQLNKLKRINEIRWATEDDIRKKERLKRFDSEFIDLARSVYFTSDQRSEFKLTIKERLGSDFVEDKSYEEYQ